MLAALRIVLAVFLVGVSLPSGAVRRTEVALCGVPSQPSIQATAQNVDLAQGILNWLAGILAPANVDVGVAVGGVLLEGRAAQTLLQEHLESGGSGPGFDAKRKRLEQRIRENELSMATLGTVLGRSLVGPLGDNAGGGNKAPAAVGEGAAPTAAAKVSPLEATTYTGKVRAQMRPNLKTGRPDNHGFPLEVDNSAGLGTQTRIRGGDGVSRTKIELDGSYNGQQGHFEWIVEPNGMVNHRLFVPKPGGTP